MRSRVRAFAWSGLAAGLSLLSKLSGLLALPRSDRDERGLEQRALKALKQVGCEEVAGRLPRTLPFAVRKRVAA